MPIRGDLPHKIKDTREEGEDQVVTGTRTTGPGMTTRDLQPKAEAEDGVDEVEEASEEALGDRNQHPLRSTEGGLREPLPDCEAGI